MTDLSGVAESAWQRAIAEADESRQQGQYDRSAELYEAACRLAEKFGPRDVRLGRSLCRQGHLISFLHSFLAAEPTLRRALSILDQHLPPDDPDVVACVADLASAYFIHGNHAAAEPLQKRFLEVRVNAAGLETGEVAALTLNLGTSLRKQGKHSEAEQLLQRWISAGEKVYDADQPDMIRMFQNLADLYSEQAKHDAAEPLLRGMLAAALRAEAPRKSGIARLLHQLALNQSSQGRNREAEDFFRQSLAQDEQIRVVEDFARFLRQQGRTAEADELDARVGSLWNGFDMTH